MRVLVTGASGFVGRRLVPALVADGHDVCRFGGPDEATAGGERSVDLRDGAAVAAAVRSVAPDAVVHLGGLSSVGDSWKRPGDYLRINFEGTDHVLRAAEGCRVVFASTGEVYGRVPEDEQPIREDRPLDPRSPYAMTKACAEVLARDFGAVVVRSFNAVGPGQNPRFALPSFARQLAAAARGTAESRLRVGDLSSRRDFLHVDDAVDAYRILLVEGEPGECYNLASGEALSIGAVLDRLIAISGVDAAVERDESRVRPVDIPLFRGDATRLRSLGWSPSRTLADALTELWAEARAEV